MMTTLYINKIYSINRKGITFVEVMICIIIASLVFGVIYNFMSNTNRNYMYGVVNLQNLQDARLAINYLRRDFASSCPLLLGSGQDKDWFINLQKIRNQLFVANNTNNLPGNLNNCLLQVTKEGLMFYKFKNNTFNDSVDYATPKVELISYIFDKNSRTLTRKSNTKGDTIFTGFKDVTFSIYTHEYNPNIPLLWVKFVINEYSNMYGSDKKETDLEITTTISSNFINSSQNNKYWRYETGFKYE